MFAERLFEPSASPVAYVNCVNKTLTEGFREWENPRTVFRFSFLIFCSAKQSHTHTTYHTTTTISIHFNALRYTSNKTSRMMYTHADIYTYKHLHLYIHLMHRYTCIEFVPARLFDDFSIHKTVVKNTKNSNRKTKTR